MCCYGVLRVRDTARPTISAVIAAGVHLFPFRTEKLSPLAPMVLGEQSPGRVGSRRSLSRAARAALSFCPRRLVGARASRDRALAGVGRARRSADGTRRAPPGLPPR